MREILFRGKRLDNGKWVEGYLFDDDAIESSRFFIGGITIENSKCIARYFDVTGYCLNEVIPDTVGQYTGLTDNNGKKIFEGDIIETAIGVGYVVYGTACFSMQDIHSKNRPALDIVEDASGLEIEVIGNIFDNPELLK